MNKLFGYGRTRTRLSLILLSALAFLCIAIVTLCVFYNLNALATNNIAFAEEDEPVRFVQNGGYADDNMIPLNYAYNWTYNLTLDYTSSNPYLLYSSNNVDCYIWGSGTFTNNVVSTSGDFYIRFVFRSGSYRYTSNGTSYASVVGYSTCTYSSIVSLFYTSSSLSYTTNSGNSFNYCVFNNVSTFPDDSYMQFRFRNGGTVSLKYFGFYNSGSFTGYVSPDYKYFDGGSSEPSTPSDFTNETGLVGSNQLKYSYWVDADFSVESTSGYTTIYEEDNQRIQVQAGNLSGNTLSSVDYRSTRTALYYRVPKPSGAYTLAVYISAVHGLWNFGVVNTEYLIDLDQGLNVIHVPAPSESRESRDAYIQFNILATDINDEITISWFKLEDGDAFTGYVAPDNSNSYEAGYEQGVVDGYNQGLSDLNNAMSYLNNSFMQTKGPYYVESVTNSVDPNDSTFEIIEHAFFSDISGVTYGNYVPVYFALNMDFPIGSDLHWIINGTLNIYTSLSTPEELHTIHYGFYDSLSFITYGPEYVPWQNTISYTSNITDLTFHANYSGSFLVMWLYTDNTSPYVKFTYRTPIVDSSFSFDPYSFAYNTYSLSATEVVDAARQQGYSEGFNTGYNQGKFENSSSQTYTFKNLIGAVFDAPITALVGKYDEETDARIGGLLNFEILGVNLGGFVIGLLSLAIILFVLRVFMRGL